MNPEYLARMARAVEEVDGHTWGVSAAAFLALYILWFGVIFGLVLLLQWGGLKNLPVTILAVICFETPAILRLTLFAPPYLHHWFSLLAAMVLGLAAFGWHAKGRIPGR